MYHGNIRGAYLEGINLFFDEYVKLTKDEELFGVVAPFFAFRGAVVANPVFYPELGSESRKKIFNFIKMAMLSDIFEIKRINDYLGT
jgi:hypothetical protein